MFIVKLVARVTITGVMVVLACLLAVALWNVYMVSPWTRDGRVRAYVVDVAPEVSGTVVQLLVHDNEFVHKGDAYSQSIRPATAFRWHRPRPPCRAQKTRCVCARTTSDAARA